MITKEQFMSYVDVQEEGEYNMLDPMARYSTGLDKKEYMEVLRNYGELHDKYMGGEA